MAEPEDLATQTAAITPTTPPSGPCQEEICGSNSPVIDVIGFHELNLHGIPNLEGFAILTIGGAAQIVKGTTWYNLHVSGGIITGTKSWFTLAGGALVDAWIPIRNVKTGRKYRLVIRAVRPLSYFVATPPGSPVPPPFEAYSLEYLGDGSVDNRLPVCDNIEGLREFQRKDQEQAVFELMGLDVAESVVYEGDRVETLGKTMSKLADDDWFNIGCAGHTLAKLFLTRNTVHSQRTGLSRAWEQRQASLKLLVADYCGTGTPFTVFGQKLYWKGDLMTYFGLPGGLEARWNENGALCLNDPRMEHPTTPLGSSQFPDIWSEISKVCRVPRCANLSTSDFAGADRVSANP